MDKIKAFWKLMLIFGILVFGLLIVFFIVNYVGYNANIYQTSEILGDTNLDEPIANNRTQDGGYIGSVSKIGDRYLTIIDTDGYEIDFGIDEGTKYVYFSPLKGDYEDSDFSLLSYGMPINIYVADMESEISLANKIEMMPLVQISGIVDSLSESGLTVSDSQSEKYIIDINENSQIFVFGDEILKTLDYLEIGDSIIVSSNSQIVDNKVVSNYIEILEIIESNNE